MTPIKLYAKDKNQHHIQIALSRLSRARIVLVATWARREYHSRHHSSHKAVRTVSINDSERKKAAGCKIELVCPVSKESNHKNHPYAEDPTY